MSLPRPGRCLGEKIAELADGRLDPAATERAFAHVAMCPSCRAALEAQREVRGRLAQSGDSPVDTPGDLLARLRGLGIEPPALPEPSAASEAAIPVQPTAGRVPGGAAGVRPGVVATSTRPSGARRRHGRRVALATAAGAAALAVAAVVGGGSVALSGPTRPSPSIAPVVDRLTAAHATSADQMPFSGPRIVTAAFGTPSGASSPQP